MKSAFISTHLSRKRGEENNITLGAVPVEVQGHALRKIFLTPVQKERGG